MRNAIRFLSFILALSPVIAAAQVNQSSLPANTVVGRLGVGTGPAQAIPFARFQTAVSGPCGTAAPGLVPATGGGTANYLRADCTFAAPPAPTILNNQILSNISGSSAAAVGQNPSSIWDSFCSSTVGQFWVRISSAWGCMSLGYANPVWWGADPTGVSDSASAFNSAIATSLPIRWPNGTFKINSAISASVAGGCFCMYGAGSNNTILNWPNASGGITVTKTASGVNFSIRDMMLTTSQASSGTAINVVGTSHNIAYPPQSDIQDVQIRGDDFAPGTGSHCWAFGIHDHDWSAVFVRNVNVYGTWGAPGSAGCGTGLLWEGDAGTTDYAINLNVVSSAFNYGVAGIQLSSYWQGVVCNICNFNGEEGSNAIIVPGSQTGTLAGLWIAASQFNTAGNQINLATSVISGAITGNTITTYSASINGIVGILSEMQITGNNFNSNANSATQAGVVISSGSANGTIVGNTFTNLNLGVSLASGSSLWTTALNNYNTVTTKVTNSGTNNSVGTAAAGSMTGVVP